MGLEPQGELRTGGKERVSWYRLQNGEEEEIIVMLRNLTKEQR